MVKRAEAIGSRKNWPEPKGLVSKFDTNACLSRSPARLQNNPYKSAILPNES